MSIFLVLDALLLLLIALLMPIGYWRGPVKELCVTLGLLLGMLLVDYWARPWGGDLADLTDLTRDGGAFVVAMCFLIASTFIIGYGIGAALGPSWPSFQSRLLGAAISAFNGVLLLAFALQQVRLFLLSDENEESLEDAFVARFLLNQVGWVVLAVSVIAVPAIVYILLSGRRAYELIDQPEAVWDGDDGGGSYPPRVPRAPQPAVDDDDDDAVPYKADPIATPLARTSATDMTRQVQVTRPRETAEPPQPAQPSQPPRTDASGTARARSTAEPAVTIPAPAPAQPRPAQPATKQPATPPPPPPPSAVAADSAESAVPGGTDPQMPIVRGAGTSQRVTAATETTGDPAPVPPPPAPVPAPPTTPQSGVPATPAAPSAPEPDAGVDTAPTGGAGRRLRRPRNESATAVRASEPPAEDDLPAGWERCRTCHAVLPPGIGICPNCGTVRS